MSTLIWKTKKKTIEIKALKQLLQVLIKIKPEEIDTVIKINLENLLNWIRTNYSDNLELMAGLEDLKEYSPQQTREQLVRVLRRLKL